jgi:hypothetical protein
VNDRLFGSAIDDLWVVRYGGAEAYHWDGERWSTVAYPGEGRFSPGGSAAGGRVWLLGVEPTVIGPTSTQRFRLFTHEARQGLAAVTALGDDDVWNVQAFESGETLAFATRRLGSGFGVWSRVLWRHDGSRWTQVWSDAPSEAAGWRPLPGVREADDV